MHRSTHVLLLPAVSLLPTSCLSLFLCLPLILHSISIKSIPSSESPTPVCASPSRCLPPYGTIKAAQCVVWLVEGCQSGGDALSLSAAVLADRTERVKSAKSAQAVLHCSLLPYT